MTQEKLSSSYKTLREYREAKAELKPKPELPEATKEYIRKLREPQKPKEEKKSALSIREIALLLKKRAEVYLNFDRPEQSEYREYSIDAVNWPVIKMLILYFINDPDFEKYGEGFSLKKGIMLRGDVGRGKTLLLKLFSHIPSINTKAEIKTFRELRQHGWPDGLMFNSAYTINQFVSCKQVEREFLKSGHAALDLFTRKDFAFSGKPEKMKIFCFDDLGTESTNSKHYGNNAMVMEEILMERYELFVEHGVKTHITTNLMRGEDLEQIYGTRIRSRIREMFNIIDMPGQDRRK